MSRSAPALAPLFRSDQQLRILAEVFSPAVDELSIGELSQRSGVAQATVSREVARLAQHGLLRTRAMGRNTLVSVNWSLPWAKDLRSILVQTMGVLGQLADALKAVPGIEEAFVFGSWAARYAGQPGPPPRDIDVLMIGDADLRSVRRACREVEHDTGTEINPVVIDPAQWGATQSSAFVAQLKSQPLVRIPIERS